MIGEFGEVYILDWGIAAGLPGTEGAQICGEASAGAVVGTPGYLAPEMLLGEKESLSPRTDVYLLGAVLFEVLAGHAPHTGDTVEDILRSTLSGRVEVPEGTPWPLARLCERALSSNIEARPESAEAFRHELREYLRTRHATQLVREASTRLDALERAIKSASADDRGHEHRIYNLFGQSRFGFQQALEVAPSNARAQANLRRTVEAIVRYELARENPEAAASFAAEAEISSSLRVQIDDALASAHEERGQLSSLRAIAQDHDPHTGLRARRVVAWSLATIWVIPPLLITLLSSSPLQESHAGLVAISGVLLLVITTALWIARRSIQKTSFNRRTANSFLYLGFALLVLSTAMALAGASPTETVVQSLFVCFSVAATLTIAVDARLLATALACAIAYVVASALPELRYPMLSFIGLAFFLNVELIWSGRVAPVDS
jgi:serine/threonine-protein kinase